MAAPEQAQDLSTRSIEARIHHTRQYPRCTLCKDAPGTIQHITAGCSKQPGRIWKHNGQNGIGMGKVVEIGQASNHLKGQCAK